MARYDRLKPFEVTSNEPLQVEAGTFTGGGEDHIRTGATNVRATRPGLLMKWRSYSEQRRVNIISLAVSVLVVVILLPTLVAFVGVSSREAIADRKARAMPNADIVVVSEEVRAAADSVKPTLGAFASSSIFINNDVSKTMGTKFEAVSESLIYNNVDATRSRVEEANSYFAGEYTQALINIVPTRVEEWFRMKWDTSRNIEAGLLEVQSHHSKDQLPQLSEAIVKLAESLGEARSQHLYNKVSYSRTVPRTSTPANTATPEPTLQQDKPQPVQTRQQPGGRITGGNQGSPQETAGPDGTSE